MEHARNITADRITGFLSQPLYCVVQDCGAAGIGSADLTPDLDEAADRVAEALDDGDAAQVLLIQIGRPVEDVTASVRAVVEKRCWDRGLAMPEWGVASC